MENPMEGTCIFCPNELNGSDEHIIPQSVNGQLHSKEIICSECNNKFGVNVDPIIKETLTFILHVLKIGNKKKLVVQDEAGTSYLVDNVTGKIKHIKPEISTFKVDEDKIGITVSGADEINTYKALAKKAVRMFGMGALKGKYSVTKSSKVNTALSTKAEIITSPQLILALNKIIIEYFCYCGLEKALIQPLVNSVAKLDENLENLRICNTSHNVRKPGNTEISHLIVIRSDEEKKIIYGYTEIFNIICGYTVLVDNYEGDKIDFVYHQDAITKETISGEIILNIDLVEQIPKEFSHNINALFVRHEDRNIYEHVSLICEDIKTELDLMLDKQEITNKEHENIYIDRATKAIAELMVFVYPDAVEDFSEKELKEVNYIHSLIRADKIEEFKYFYHQFIGHEFKFEDDNTIYKMDEFVFAKHRPRNGAEMVKVYCSFTSETGAAKKHWLATEVFKYSGVPFLPDDFVWL